MTHRIFAAALMSAAAALPATAQFSSDIPGVPRAAIAVRGGHQDRTEWTGTWYHVPTLGSGGDTTAVGVRVGFGASYRIMNNFELGYDLTLLDGLGVFPSSSGNSTPNQPQYLRGLAAYGIRVGGKYRAVTAVDPDGNGYAIAFGAAFEPQLQPLYGIERLGDSTRQGGQLSHSHQVTAASTTFDSNPFAKLSASTDLAAMGSYRARRLILDAAVMVDKLSGRAGSIDPSPLAVTDGASIHAGGAFRLTPSIAVGGAYWGTGTSPWRDEVRFGAPGVPKQSQYAYLLQFGSSPEAGIDLMYTAPTGNFGQSGRVYLRARSTR